jgi:benzoyl-CoA reductase/2-hydroxyglutaryl-CoA dehydratase subunit BcrC/BadD/HgdB
MGLEPVVLWGMKPFLSDSARSDQHLQSFVCSVGRHLTEFVLSEEGALLDGLFMYNACDTLRNLPEILRSGLEDQGRRMPILNLHIPMPPVKQTDARQYLRNEIEGLTNRLSEAFGVSFSEDRFERSVALYAKAKALSRQLEAAVAEGRVSFGRFADRMHGNILCRIEDQIDRSSSLLSGADRGRGKTGGNSSPISVILSGILPPPSGVSDIIEQAGLGVVGNDIASLARSYG